VPTLLQPGGDKSGDLFVVFNDQYLQSE
jgi:hypothetical protein